MIINSRNLFSVCVLFIAALCNIETTAAAKPFGVRYVLQGTDIVKMKKDVVVANGTLGEDLRYHKAFIAHLPTGAANKLKAKHPGAIIEIDGMVQTLGVRVNGKGGGSSTTQPPQSIPWGVSAVSAPEAFLITRGGGATVCVVDTGVQPDHPDLWSNIIGGENFVSIKGRINPSAWADDNGHGTHVAGTIAAIDNGIGAVGVAPQSAIFATKVLNRQGSGYNSAIAEGIRSCVNHGARVVNLSLGGPSDSTILHNAIIDASNAGLKVVAAAGNESTQVSYPARYQEVIAVSAVDSAMKFAWFSNFGPEVDFTAPGVSVYSTVKGSSYATYSGTSMAAPHVSGVAALMISTSGIGLVGRDIGLPSAQQGAGFIDAFATVSNR
ncbi:MAG: S8 family peptidase [Bdellovibrionota bacterium]